LVESIASALGGQGVQRSTNDRGETVIALNDLRNYSRAGQGEFNYLLKRLATLLSHAGRDERMQFVVEDRSAATGGARPQYRMQGAAYLITAEGFDQWELFLSMTPSDRDLAMWDARGAVRVLRTARPDAAQVTYPVESRSPAAP
jgi:hypothetical protein